MTRVIDPARQNVDASGARQRRISRRRLWLFRLTAVLLGLSLFVAAELVCVLFDWGRPSSFDDPFVGFSAVHPLFVLSEDGARYEIPESRLLFFAPESFPAQKGEREFRVFCLGGSTVQGRPFSKETSFTTWLDLSLRAADPSRDWRVINCGGISYASYRLVPILKECLQYQPDLFIICTGHNEFLEERTYDHVKHAPAIVSVPQRAAARLRSYTLLRQAVFAALGRPSVPDPGDRPKMKPEVDPLLDYFGGLAAFTRNDDWQAGVLAHYESNLRRMVAMAGEADVPVILMRPPSNLCDCPPFKSEHRDGLSAQDRARWVSLMLEAQARYRDDVEESVRLLKPAFAIDDRYASAWYELGKCYETLGRFGPAREAFVRARDEDICPLRILSSMEEALARVAADAQTPLLDAHALLEARAPEGILGNFLLVDHIHPSFEGHQLIAGALTEHMAAARFLSISDGWPARRDKAFRARFDSLESFYFLKGQRTLESLRAWTQGRADGPPIEQRLQESGER